MTRLLTQVDWNIRWILSNPDKYLLGAARHYECAREAVLEADLTLPLCKQWELPISEVYSCYENGHINKRRPRGAIWYLRFCEPGGLYFPLASFQAVLPHLTDLAEFAGRLEYEWREYLDLPVVGIIVPKGLSREQAVEYFLKQYAREDGVSPKCGAGAVIRQHKTILKYLAATRVLKYLSAQFAFTKSGPIITEAKLLTAEVFGKPLLDSDQEWIKARAVIHEVITDYQREIDWLRTVFPISEL